MYIDVVLNENSRPTVFLCESYKEGERIVKRTLANITDWSAEEIEMLGMKPDDEPLVRADTKFSVTESRRHGDVDLVLRAMRKLDVSGLLDRSRSPGKRTVMAMTAQRIIQPEPRPALLPLAKYSTLGDEMGLDGPDEDDIYGAMDWLAKRQEKIEKKLAGRRRLRGTAYLLYDVADRCWEGQEKPSAAVWGVLADERGVPAALRSYPDGGGDPAEVLNRIERLREEFGLRNVVLMAYGGTATDALTRDAKQRSDIGWISVLRADEVGELVDDGEIDIPFFGGGDTAEITSEKYPGQRLVAYREPPEEEPGAEEEAETEPDGLGTVWAFRTDRPVRELSADAVVRRCMNLGWISNSFWRMSGGDHFYFMTSPPQLREEEKEREPAHFFLCMLACYVEWHMRDALEEILFADEEEPAAPRKPSEKAEKKKRTKRVPEFDSFPRLLEMMSSIHRIRVETEPETGRKPKREKKRRMFFNYTRPNAFQSRVFDLMESYPWPELKDG